MNAVPREAHNTGRTPHTVGHPQPGSLLADFRLSPPPHPPPSPIKMVVISLPQENLASVTNSINSDYITPLAHLARNPSTIHYSTAISARLSYFMAQQTVVSSTVGGKLTVDPVALARAVLAALAGGREEPVLEALRLPEERITSTENYAWWSRNLKGIVTLMK